MLIKQKGFGKDEHHSSSPRSGIPPKSSGAKISLRAQCKDKQVCSGFSSLYRPLPVTNLTLAIDKYHIPNTPFTLDFEYFVESVPPFDFIDLISQSLETVEEYLVQGRGPLPLEKDRFQIGPVDSWILQIKDGGKRATINYLDVKDILSGLRLYFPRPPGGRWPGVRTTYAHIKKIEKTRQVVVGDVLIAKATNQIMDI